MLSLSKHSFKEHIIFKCVTTLTDKLKNSRFRKNALFRP